jgi:predicted permease
MMWRARSRNFAESLLADIRFAARGMRKNLTFTLVAVLTAAFGITLSTFVFAILNASILRPLPHVRDPGELVKVFRLHPSEAGVRHNFSYADFESIRDRATTVEDVVAVVRWVEFMVRSGTGLDRKYVGAEVSENYFQALGIPMAIGRPIVPEDADSGEDVAVIGHAMWQRDFGASVDVLGRRIRVDGKSCTIVGVAPPGLNWLNEEPVEAAVWLPIRPGRKDATWGDLRLAGRRRPEFTLAQVQAEFDVIAEGLAAANPEAWSDRSEQQIRVRVMTDLQSRFNFVGARAIASLIVWLVLVGMIMLITCSNVANLFLTRVLKRRFEIAVRLALGASQWRLVRQLLTESVILFLLAGSLGLLLIHWLTRLLAAGWGPLPAADVTVDARVTAFAVALAVASGLVFGLAPALQATRPDHWNSLKGTDKIIRFKRFGTRNLFVLGQVAGSMVLVAISALLMRDVQMTNTLDVGFDADNITVLSLDLDYGDYDSQGRRQFLTDLTEHLGRTPGVEEVAIASWVPMSGNRWSVGVQPQGYGSDPNDTQEVVFNAVTPGFFHLLRIPFLTGRDFTVADDAHAQTVVIVNEAFARRFWENQVALGKTVVFAQSQAPAVVVGVVRDARYAKEDFTGEATSPHIWLPRAQNPHSSSHVHVRARGDQAFIMRSIRDDVRLLAENLPIVDLGSMESITARALEEERVAAVVFGGFGVAALFLAMLGIYGVQAFAVMDRVREIGIRIALGATPARVVAMIVTRSLKLSSLGIVAGLILAALVAMGMQSLLVGIGALDPLSLGGSAVLLVLAAVAASLVPAIQAARVDPSRSLRSE